VLLRVTKKSVNGLKTKGAVMKKFKFLVLAGVAAIVVSGCAGSVNNETIAETKSIGGMQTTRDVFKSALHKEYLALAIAEQKEGDGDDARFFLLKAKNAGLGLDVLPQQLDERVIAKQAKGQLAKARTVLVNKLWNGGSELTPGPAARAQAMFDCWMQEQEENDQFEHIRTCRQAFQAALFDTKVRKKNITPTAAKSLAPMPGTYVMYFALDNAAISSSELVKIKLIFADFRLRKPNKILVAGHTDSSGNKKYNLGLSRARAAAVGNRLMEIGIPREIIKQSRYGEIAPVVDKGDNKSEGKNRRVTITFLR
jgi:outer membrane protein OmpA-like peptidoglycan-associated protein